MLLHMRCRESIQSAKFGCPHPSADTQSLLRGIGRAAAHAESKSAEELPAPQDIIADSVDRHIQYALNDTLGDTAVWDIKMWLTGISTDGTSVRVGTSSLRPCIPEDLIFESRAGAKTFWDNEARNVPSSVLETTIEAHDALELHKKETRLIVSLRLLRPSIFSTYTFYSPRSLIELSSRSSSLNPRSAPSIRVTDVNETSYYIEALPSLIPDDLLKGTYLPTTLLAMAYASCEKASDSRLPPQDIVSECVKGLEALFKEPEWRGSVGVKLATRVARALRVEGLDQKTVKSHVRIAYYQMRNPTFHGAPIKAEDRHLAFELAAPMLDYLHRCIVLRIKTS